ncbi:Zinc finger protein 19 [Manis javanica]|nr:Zinc finger protein 19 [Manis javanica]
MTFEDMDMSGHFTWTERAGLSPIQRAPYREVVLTDHGCPASTPALISLLEVGDLPWGLEANDCPPAERTKDISKGL